MTVKPKLMRLPTTERSRLRACIRQSLMIVLINVPMISCGLALGWMSLASGESVATDLSAGGGPGSGDVQVVVAAAATFGAALLGVLLSARLLAAGRKVAVMVTSGLFAACWSLKLSGSGWWLVGARACAGLASAGAWAVAPLLAKEICSGCVSGAAVAALVLASNLGELCMYCAAYLRVSHSTVLWSCLSLSVVHCGLFAFVPESPHYLAAQGEKEKARKSLAWWRGLESESLELMAHELMDLPGKEKPLSAVRLIKQLLSDEGRRRAFILCCVMVVGQESCGVLALMQFAERVFVLARDQAGGSPMAPEAGGVIFQPALYAVLLGVFQLLASGFSLYFVEKVGRKSLMVWCGLVTGASMGVAACAVQWAGAGASGQWSAAGGQWAAAAMCTAVFADSAGLQPASYAMMADMFDYEYRGCAVLLIALMSWLGNALEVVLFPTVAIQAGLTAALALSAALTLALVLFALWSVPETRGRSTTEIYKEILGHTPVPSINLVLFLP